MTDLDHARPPVRSRRGRALAVVSLLAAAAVQVGVLPATAEAVVVPFSYSLTATPVAPGPVSVGSEIQVTGTATNNVDGGATGAPATLVVDPPAGVSFLRSTVSNGGAVSVAADETASAVFNDGVPFGAPAMFTAVYSVDSPAALFEGAGNDLVFAGALQATGVAGSPFAAAPIGFDINEPGAITSYPGCRANTIPRNDDGSSDEVELPFAFNFFGTTYNSLWVNNNGNVTFDGPQYEYVPYELGATSPMIAAFFTDVDTRNPATMEVSYGAVRVNPDATNPDAFCANWVEVGEYSNGAVLNSFQMLLINRGGGDVDVVLNYDKILWDHGGAGIGYTAGTGDADTYYELPGSRDEGAFLDSSPTSLIGSSQDSLQLGRYLFRLRGGLAPVGGRVSGIVRDPAGNPLAGAPVQVCPVLGTCVLTQTGSTGRYNASGLPAGTYTVFAGPPAEGSNMLGTFGTALTISEPTTAEPLFGSFVRDITLEGTLAPPEDVDFVGRRTAEGGVPVVYFSDTPALTYNACVGGVATYNYYRSGIAQGDPSPMTEGPPGVYSVSAVRPFNTSGNIEIRINVLCPGGAPADNAAFPIYIDPSGWVRHLDGTPIVGATVVLYRSDNVNGPFEVVPDQSAIMSPSNRTNPDVTDAAGHFGWDVIAGYYKVRASATVDGRVCTNPTNAAEAFRDTHVMNIPPPVFDLDIRLSCGVPPAPVGNPVHHVDVPVVPSTSPSPTAAPSSAPVPSVTPAPVVSATPTTSAAPTAPTAPTGAGSISLSVDVPVITAGNRPTLSGLARGADGAPLANTTLQVLSNTGSGWRALADAPTVVTDSAGRFALRVAPTVRTAYGVNLDSVTRSNVVGVLVHTRIDITGLPMASWPRVPVSGQTVPAKGGQLIGLSEVIGRGRRFLGSATVAPDGTFRVSSNVDLAPGVHVLVVHLSPTATNLGGSRSVTVTVG